MEFFFIKGRIIWCDLPYQIVDLSGQIKKSSDLIPNIPPETISLYQGCKLVPEDFLEEGRKCFFKVVLHMGKLVNALKHNSCIQNLGPEGSVMTA